MHKIVQGSSLEEQRGVNKWQKQIVWNVWYADLETESLQWRSEITGLSQKYPEQDGALSFNAKTAHEHACNKLCTIQNKQETWARLF